MFKKSVFKNSNWIFFMFSLLIFPCLSFHCIEDDLIENKKHINTRSIKYHDIKAEREKNLIFEPLIIHFYQDTNIHDMPLTVIYNIKLALQKVQEYIENTFQVRERKNPFLLQRQSCTQKWQFGINKNKCSKATNTVEVCYAKEISHVIPERYLDKLEVYEFGKSKPKHSERAGPGLLESNFIAFVKSEITSVCDGKDVSAYGAACRFDNDSGEPLAGILNICPNYFSARIYPFEHYYNVVLHEMFHILGFSGPLFEKYLPCEEGRSCDLPKNVVQYDNTGVPRLLFPLVVEHAQKHFNCFNPDFGGPMAIKGVADYSTYDSASFYSSHWHPLLMHSSIMTPSFTEFEKLFVDEITLAVFASTGWYRINFTKADNFDFGKGQGCNFGLNGTCAQSPYLCDASNQTAIGCDLNHKTIGHCISVTDTHTCGVFQPYSIRDCALESESHYGLDFYSLGYNQKCFMEQTESLFQPTCLPVRCKSESTYDIFVNMTWYACNSANQVLKSDVSVRCPDGLIFCLDSGPKIHSGPERVFCTVDHFFIAVRMYFSLPKFGYLRSKERGEEFKVTTLQRIAKHCKIPVNYIVNSTLSAFKQVYLDFVICPPTNLKRDQLNEIVSNTQQFLDSRSMVHILLEPDGEVIVASNDIKIHPSSAISFSDYEGFRALLIFPVICGIFIIVTFIASILRRFLIKKHKPRRYLEMSPSSILSQEVNV